jgi:hypothetical protein
MTSRRRKKVGAFAVAVVITLVLGACVGDAVETGPTGSPDEIGRSDERLPEVKPAPFGGFDLPPEGAVPSSPETGKVIARFKTHQFHGQVFVYADGRVITSWGRRRVGVEQQRLTPEGIDLFRSGAVEPHRFSRPRGPSLPAGAWADPDARPYVPSRYAVCYAEIRTLHNVPPRGAPPLVGEFAGYVDPSRVVSLLPAQAQDLLKAAQDVANPIFGNQRNRCSELTTEGTRTLEQILLDAGFEGFMTPEDAFAFEGELGDEVWFVMSYNPLLPHELSG